MQADTKKNKSKYIIGEELKYIKKGNGAVHQQVLLQIGQ